VLKFGVGVLRTALARIKAVHRLRNLQLKAN
jgi:hypothetical protein